MYENAQGERLSLLVTREANNAETFFRFSEGQGARAFHWIDERDELRTIARGEYQQLNP